MKNNRILIPIFIIIIFLFLLFFDTITIFKLPDIVCCLNGNLPSTSEKAISILIDLDKLLISFAIGILAGLFLFIKDFTKKRIKVFLPMSFTICIFSIFSIYFGHLVIINIAEMLANDFLQILSRTIIWPIRLQFIFLLLAIFSFLYFIYKQNIETISESHD
jgi:hypothetical protein